MLEAALLADYIIVSILVFSFGVSFTSSSGAVKSSKFNPEIFMPL
jgi:hypothetical protein